LIVYGVPLLVISLIWGRQIIAKAFKNSGTAAKYGLGFFGGFTVLGIFLAAIILVVILRFDASAIDALYMPNPALDVPPQFAWIMVWVSILVIGPVEEYLFTGFVYGGLLSLSKNRYWLGLALISSTLFSIAHMYYALIYGLISVVLFIMLLSFGMAMAATFYTSRGNLIIPAILHGVYDASAFFGIATSIDATVLIRGAMILTGLVIAIVLFVRRNQRTKTPIPPPAGIPIPASQ
jgi:membrane protease YdiL (CAAX protease family)